jgi:hypothetical protein
METYQIIISTIGTCLFIYLWMRREKQTSFEDGICYALKEHARSRIKYNISRDNDGDEIIEVKVIKED